MDWLVASIVAVSVVQVACLLAAYRGYARAQRRRLDAEEQLLAGLVGALQTFSAGMRDAVATPRRRPPQFEPECRPRARRPSA